MPGKISPHRQPPEFDPYRRFVTAVPDMVDMARTAARNAFSYRDFKVGSSVMVVDAHNAVGLEMAESLKSRREKAKVCAEKRVLAKAVKAGFLYAPGLVVAGTTDKEKIKEVTDVATPTLHCCNDCQQLFGVHPLMRRETLIVSVGEDRDAYQVMTAGEMTDTYAVDPEAIKLVPTHYGFDNWERHVDAYDRLIGLRTGEGVLRHQELAEIAKMAIRLQVVA